MTVPTWYRQLADVPGYTPDLPVDTDPSTLPGRDLVATASTEQWRMYRDELVWPSMSERGETTSVSPARQYAVDQREDEEKDPWQHLTDICSALYLPGTTGDYYAVFSSMTPLVNRKYATDAELLVATVQLAWTFADFVVAAPEVLNERFIMRDRFGSFEDEFDDDLPEDDGQRYEYVFGWLSEVLIREGHFADLGRLRALLDRPGWTWPALNRADSNIEQLHDQLA